MTNSSEALEEHLSAILEEARSLHQQAMACLETPGADPLNQLHEARRLLSSVELLARDAADELDCATLNEALGELYRQQGQVDALIVQLEVAKSMSEKWVEFAKILAVIVALTLIFILYMT